MTSSHKQLNFSALTKISNLHSVVFFILLARIITAPLWALLRLQITQIRVVFTANAHPGNFLNIGGQNSQNAILKCYNVKFIYRNANYRPACWKQWLSQWQNSLKLQQNTHFYFLRISYNSKLVHITLHSTRWQLFLLRNSATLRCEMRWIIKISITINTLGARNQG